MVRGVTRSVSVRTIELDVGGRDRVRTGVADGVGEIHPFVDGFVQAGTQHPEQSLCRVVERETRLYLRCRVRFGARELNLVDEDFGLFVDKRLTLVVVQVDLLKRAKVR